MINNFKYSLLCTTFVGVFVHSIETTHAMHKREPVEEKARSTKAYNPKLKPLTTPALDKRTTSGHHPFASSPLHRDDRREMFYFGSPLPVLSTRPELQRQPDKVISGGAVFKLNASPVRIAPSSDPNPGTETSGGTKFTLTTATEKDKKPGKGETAPHSQIARKEDHKSPAMSSPHTASAEPDGKKQTAEDTDPKTPMKSSYSASKASHGDKDEASLSPAPIAPQLTLSAGVTLVEGGNGSGDTDPKTLKPKRESDTAASTSEAIVSSDGKDRRILVKKFDEFPWSVHGHMVMDFGSGSKYIGSGTMIGDRYVLTAGHCLFDRDSGRLAERIEFFPGMSKGQVPYKSIAVQIIIHSGYLAKTPTDLHGSDMGVIKLKDPLGTEVGYFGYSDMADKQIWQLGDVNVTGYPGDRDQGLVMYTMQGTIRSTPPTQLFYDVDTYGGQSGSGVWVKRTEADDESHVCIAIHAYGGTPKTGNSGTRITVEKYDQLQKWIAELGKDGE